MEKSNLGRIRNEFLVSIKGEVVRAIADGIGVSERQVANTALESMGIQMVSIEVLDTLVTVDVDLTLSDANRRQLKTLIEQMRLDNSKPGGLARLNVHRSTNLV